MTDEEELQLIYTEYAQAMPLNVLLKEIERRGWVVKLAAPEGFDNE